MLSRKALAGDRSPVFYSHRITWALEDAWTSEVAFSGALGAATDVCSRGGFVGVGVFFILKCYFYMSTSTTVSYY